MTVSHDTVHVPVLATEVRDLLSVRPGALCVDATINGGGHAALLLDDVSPGGRLVGLERDPAVYSLAERRFADDIAAGRVLLANESFERIEAVLAARVNRAADAILFDLGVSSFHFDRSGRGFTYQHDEPLDMRFDPSVGVPTAADLVRRLPAAELTRIFRELGEERFASRIARSIAAHRRARPIRMSGELVEEIRRSLPAQHRWRHGRHAARVFQALRMAVNDELATIERALPRAIDCLAPGGRLAIISFHSLEDRAAKRTLRAAAQAGTLSLLTRKPIRASDAEVAVNPRAASAKLRAAEKR